jgi:hypothetical protein
MGKRTVKLWRLHEDGRKLFAGPSKRPIPARPQVVSVPGHGRAGHLLCHLSRQLRGSRTGTRQ